MNSKLENRIKGYGTRRCREKYEENVFRKAHYLVIVVKISDLDFTIRSGWSDGLHCPTFIAKIEYEAQVCHISNPV